MMFRLLFLCLLMNIFSIFLNAQSVKKQPDESAHVFGNGFYIGSEQDVFVDLVKLHDYNEDRNYTMGITMGKTGAYTNRNYFLLPVIRRNLSRIPFLFAKNVKAESLTSILFDESKCDNFISSFDIRAGGFTPRDLVDTLPVTIDRPYSTILSIGSYITRHKFHKQKASKKWQFHKETAISNSFSIAFFGASFSRWFQSKSHREHWFGSTRDVPKGWHNQISHDGGMGFLYTMNVSKPLLRNLLYKDEGSTFFQASINSEFMLGYHVNAAIGANFRLGLFNTPYWVGFNSMRNINASGTLSNSKNVEFFFYFKPRLRLVGHNALLQGQYVDFLSFGTTNYTIQNKHIKRAIFEFETGFVLKLYEWAITFEPLSGRSPEFDIPGGEKRWHYWGTIHFAFNLDKPKEKKGGVSPEDFKKLQERVKNLKVRIDDLEDEIDN